MKADIEAATDRGEAIAIMEPLQISEGSRLRPMLTELTVELAAKSAGFRRSLPDGVIAALPDLVRTMDCYYSNLIEGHNTPPVDIERAMGEDYSIAHAQLLATQWLWQYNNERLNTAIGGIPPSRLREVA